MLMRLMPDYSKTASISDMYAKGGVFFEHKNNYGRGTLHLAVDGAADTNNVEVSDAKLSIDSAGNVGIGTTSPSATLDVAGTLEVNGESTFNIDADSQLIIGNAGTNATMIYSGASDGLYIGANNTYQIFAANAGTYVAIRDGVNFLVGTGKVGIGTASPATPRDVAGVITATGGNSTNWNTAYGWGNHASAGYITDDTSVPKNHLANSGTLGFSWSDSEIANDITAGNIDGIDSLPFLRSDVSDTMTGTLSVSRGNNDILSGSGANSLTFGHSSSHYCGVGYNVDFQSTASWKYRGTDKASLMMLSDCKFSFYGNRYNRIELERI